jgi:hypothetical protein
MKTCSKCKTEYPIDMFYRDRAQPDGYRYVCKKCFAKYRTELASKSEKARAGILRRNKSNRVARRFNLTTDEYDKYFTDADGCGICSTKEKKLVLDHCHITGRVRGVLCENCNFAIGHLNDSIELLQKGIKWLEK